MSEDLKRSFQICNIKSQAVPLIKFPKYGKRTQREGHPTHTSFPLRGAPADKRPSSPGALLLAAPFRTTEGEAFVLLWENIFSHRHFSFSKITQLKMPGFFPHDKGGFGRGRGGMMWVGGFGYWVL